MKKTRIVLVSCSVILLCLCIIAGMSYALFTDSASAINHLKAGKLDVTLQRTNLSYSVINEEGVFETVKDDKTVVDFTDATGENAFGLDSTTTLIAPGSYFDSEMTITNNGNVAFNYTVKIVLKDGTDEVFAKQLKVITTDAEGNVAAEKMLSDYANGVVISNGNIGVSTTGDPLSETFKVYVEFVDITANKDNNNAMDKNVFFDIVVEATQVTA